MINWVKIRVLGSGSYGTVYLADYEVPQGGYGVIAIKSARPFMLYSVYSLEREERILRSFTGRQEIIQCYGNQITKENGVFIYNLLMEFAPYGNLGSLIREKSLSEATVKACTRMLLKGLSCIHRKGVVHCDLKPENILIFPLYLDSDDETKCYQLKIADFGLSKTREENFDAKNWRFKFRGSPRYMSPESVYSGEIEAALDIWSLGCIVIEMLTGVPVWSNISHIEDLMYMLAYVKKAPEIPNWVSKECIDFLRRCFIKNQRRRPSADDLLSHPFVLDSNRLTF